MQYAPAYNLLTHNCQVQAKQIIGFGFTAYRPPWWSIDMERQYVGKFVNNRVYGSGTGGTGSYASALSSLPAGA